MKFKTEIVPKTGWFDINLREIWQYRDLVLLLVNRDFVSIYKQTVLGPLWAIIQPLLTTVIFTVIFGNIAGLSADGTPPFMFYMSGTIVWTYFSMSLTTTASTFIVNRNILGKVYFPRLVMPISTVLSKLISFIIQLVFFAIFVVYYALKSSEVNPNLYILMLPLLILQLAMLGLGFGIIISALTTKYRDLAMLITFGIQLWMYMTPIAYGMNIIPAKYFNIYMLNPITPIVNLFRYSFLGLGEIQWIFYGISWVVTLFVVFLGIILFSRVEKTFMDTV